MRPITSFTLHAILAAALTAFAATSAAAAKPQVDNEGHAFLSFELLGPGAKGSKGEKLEIQSFQWGPRQTTSADGSAQRDGKESDASAGKGASNEMRMEDSAGSEKMQPGGGSAVGASEKLTVDGGRTESGQATGKRQHLPIRSRTYYDQSTAAPSEKRQHGWVTVSKPLDRGAVRVKVKFPWVGCAVGNRYPAITLGDGANSYQLQDVSVASCGSAAEGPEESITFVYGKLGTKVKVRGWDPEKKEE